MQTKNNNMDKLRDAIYGLAVGDAMGVPFESLMGGTYNCTAMVGYLSHHQPKGTWSDDTSMTLATCDSIRENNGINYQDLMDKFCDWYYNGRYSCHGEVFDIGQTTQLALIAYKSGVKPLWCGSSGEWSCGNGSLMRILPLAFIPCSDKEIAAVSRITHAHAIPIRCCIEYVRIARHLINGATIKDAIGDDYNKIISFPKKLLCPSGYVLDTFVTALWCLCHTDNYRDCILTAVNLGGDTDTIAAVVGGLAGIVYGYDGIPIEWIEQLLNKDIIESCIKWE